MKRGKWDNCNSIINKIYLKQFILLSSPKDIFLIAFRERGKERGREREKHQCKREISMGCLWYVPRPGIKPATFWLWYDVPSHNLVSLWDEAKLVLFSHTGQG